MNVLKLRELCVGNLLAISPKIDLGHQTQRLSVTSCYVIRLLPTNLKQVT